MWLELSGPSITDDDCCMFFNHNDSHQRHALVISTFFNVFFFNHIWCGKHSNFRGQEVKYIQGKKNHITWAHDQIAGSTFSKPNDAIYFLIYNLLLLLQLATQTQQAGFLEGRWVIKVIICHFYRQRVRFYCDIYVVWHWAELCNVLHPMGSLAFLFE